MTDEQKSDYQQLREVEQKIFELKKNREEISGHLELCNMMLDVLEKIQKDLQEKVEAQLARANQ